MKDKMAELSRAATILFTNKDIFMASLIRIINTISLFGFAIIMPLLFVDRLDSPSLNGYRFAVFFFVTIFTNIFGNCW